MNWVYVTAKDREEAMHIGRLVVEERLAACANVLGPMASFYWWEDRVQADEEAVLILKTREELVDALVGRVRALHSYSCPCVVVLPIVGGNPDYLAWLAKETAG